MRSSDVKCHWPMWFMVIVIVLAVTSCDDRQTAEKKTQFAGAQNEVVLYLQGAERQSESAAQEQEILKALEDLRTLPPEKLRERRYADYALTPGQWTLGQLLQKYFVPSMPRVVDEETLYRDAQDPKARATIEEHIKAIREQRQTFRVPTETATMPINNRVGFDNHECGLPPRPESRQPRP